MLFDPKWENPTETKPSEAWRELLLRAVIRIEQYGWMQGDLGDSDGPVCAMGAIHYEWRGYQKECSSAEADHALDELARYLDLKDPNPHLHRVAAWNDAQGRTRDEVIAAMRGAALG